MKSKNATVSLCMIVRNEEKNLPICLESVKDLFDEIVIVDTGSRDRTKEIAKSYGAKVIDFTWKDDFSAARNKGLDAAKSNWIFWLDADHFVDQDNYNKLKKLFSELGDDKIAYGMQEISRVPSRFPTSTFNIRLFKNNSRARWVYAVHEQIQQVLQELGYQIQTTDIQIYHTGADDPNLERSKLERNIAILEKERKKNVKDPDHLPHTLFDLARSYRSIGKFQEALDTILEAKKVTPAGHVYSFLIYPELLLTYQALGRWDDALDACQRFKEVSPQVADPYFLESLIYEKKGDVNNALSSLLKLAEPQAKFQTNDLFLVDKIRYRIGLLFYKQGNITEAEKRWKEAVQLNPDDRFSWLGLTELFINQRRFLDALASSQRTAYLMPEFIDPVYWESIAWDQLGYPGNALNCISQYLKQHAVSCNIFNSNMIEPARIEHNLGVYCFKSGKEREAEGHLGTALNLNPQFEPSWQALTDLWLVQHRWSDVETVISQLKSDKNPLAEELLEVLEAKLQAVQGDPSGAINRLQAFVKSHPRAIRARITLSIMLSNTAVDKKLIKDTLNEVLALSPGHPEATEVLARLS